MVSHNRGPQQQVPATDPDAGTAWLEERIASLDDAVGMVEDLLRELDAAGYSGEARRRVRRVLEDAVIATLERGGSPTPGQRLRVGYCVASEYALAEVEGRMEVVASTGLQGPHRPVWSEIPVPRFYTWLRCDRFSGRVQACRCWPVP
jgi:hypothetical protein